MSCLSGQWEWKVTCPEGKSTCPRQPDGTFFEPWIRAVFSVEVSHHSTVRANCYIGNLPLRQICQLFGWKAPLQEEELLEVNYRTKSMTSFKRITFTRKCQQSWLTKEWTKEGRKEGGNKGSNERINKWMHKCMAGIADGWKDGWMYRQCKELNQAMDR